MAVLKYTKDFNVSFPLSFPAAYLVEDIYPHFLCNGTEVYRGYSNYLKVTKVKLPTQDLNHQSIIPYSTPAMAVVCDYGPE